jgi:hypothetical protein
MKRSNLARRRQEQPQREQQEQRWLQRLTRMMQLLQRCAPVTLMKSERDPLQ